MNVSKTVLTVFIALLAIGLSGIVAANGATSSTQQTFVGEGSYETSWNGNSGMMAIHTYTSNGNDHLNVDYHTGRTTGEQTGMTENGWTQVDREVSARGHDVKISANTFDNSNDISSKSAIVNRLSLQYEAARRAQSIRYDRPSRGYTASGKKETSAQTSLRREGESKGQITVFD